MGDAGGDEKASDDLGAKSVSQASLPTLPAEDVDDEGMPMRDVPMRDVPMRQIGECGSTMEMLDLVGSRAVSQTAAVGQIV